MAFHSKLSLQTSHGFPWSLADWHHTTLVEGCLFNAKATLLLKLLFTTTGLETKKF